MKLNKQLAMIVAGLLAFAAVIDAMPASAQGTSAQRTACMGDALRYCSADIPDVSKIEACLLQNRDRLRPACQAQFDSVGTSRLQPEHFR
jgi:hypothetical protein